MRATENHVLENGSMNEYPLRTRVLIIGNKRTKNDLIGQEGVVVKTRSLGGWHWLQLENGEIVKVQRNALCIIQQDDFSDDAFTNHYPDSCPGLFGLISSNNIYNSSGSCWRENNKLKYYNISCNNGFYRNLSTISSEEEEDNNIVNEKDDFVMKKKRYPMRPFSRIKSNVHEKYHTTSVHNDENINQNDNSSDDATINFIPAGDYCNKKSISTGRINLCKLSHETLLRYRKVYRLGVPEHANKSLLLRHVSGHFDSMDVDEYSVLSHITFKRFKLYSDSDEIGFTT